MKSRRLFIISNRLPMTIQKEGNELTVIPSAGGLITAINNYLKNSKANANEFSETFWVGMPCCNPAAWTEAAKKLPRSKYTYLPVFTSSKTYDQYYNGFSNSTIWPLFHYFPSFTEYNTENYHCYVQANAAFAKALIKYARPGDVIWIHDYHLLPLAQMLRTALPELTIGFFLHIPFPSYEIFRLLPRKWQEELLYGMLGADLVGFHTIDYTAHFLQCVRMILGLEHDMHVIEHENRLIKVDVFPISIDFDHFNNGYDHEQVVQTRTLIQEKFSHKKIIFSVDRLDYTKGVSNRLRAYELFLQRNPQFKEKVVFILVIVPSREGISKYTERKKIFDEMIGKMNSTMGNIHWQPIIYQYNSVSFEEMVGLYTACDLALITPLRDGMNLVAKEFVASRKDKKGVLVLSEMAGAARELTSALTINPNDVDEVADKILEGLEMPEDEKMQRLEAMRNRLKQYDVQAWAVDFFNQLHQIKEKQRAFQVKFLDDLTKRNLLDEFGNSNRRLILLDYDGTLVAFAPKPQEAKPSFRLMELLQRLCENEQNNVYIISGRDSDTLDNWLGKLPIYIIAEHGAKMKLKNGAWKNRIAQHHEWKQQVQEIMEVYERRCANTFIEMKEFSIVWHYRNADAEQGRLRALELIGALNEYAYNLGVQVLMGHKIVEVRLSGFDKGSALKKEVLHEEYDFILAMGDDRTDEDMFKMLSKRKNAYTIKIGAEASYASYNLYTHQMALALLDSMSYLPVEH
ncbi:bifunctional alpha,alpha-trehalose-phosphate synthase (UDP-forming)/trehalose-phosphatase [Chitinophagaceae bacterium LB-8]|uniref:Bifunctional alpha,alpha-trehalose-phosphate synthase (UDP-forming)/trehalose-phosphatase n=1 Tax=Paraflavisolibacter caeni TaxID=2982496 RepID=A0A9X3BFP2_9BACT|nr:bifunctional alpha,alpha-trehalose-phosphate synthase (UDP-forming)/trehalose-phosphatase [Paraflavisolibacter caeni]MCU7549294.1 bifunctional alpha,alpha-trehalose-phosphate synthase (UDP-forming)/trehalose-phosphatase [Paraflavisolibacter caeni]